MSAPTSLEKFKLHYETTGTLAEAAILTAVRRFKRKKRSSGS